MKSLRSWATPVTIGTFIVMSVTGTLMFFHANTGLNKLVHEWVGLVMIAAVVAHLLMNWRAFTTYFKRPMAVTLMSVGAIVLAGSFFFGGAEQGGPGGMNAVMMSVSKAPVETLAQLSGQETDVVLAQLGATGITASASDTPMSLAGGDRAAEMEIIAAIFSR